MPLNLYIGYDTKEKIASDVCEYSVKKNSSINLTVDLLIKKNLEEKKLLYRKDDKLIDLAITFSRFLVPFLNEYKGWAIFCDCDFLWTGDIKRLLDKKDEKYAVMCVQHDYNPKSEIKMDGRQQLMYPRKNWSSMVLWNCSHPANKKIDINMVNNETGKFLHRFGWLEDKLIGNLDYKWNWLVGWYEETSNNKPEAIHFTEGGPWFENYKNCEYSKIWSQYKEEMEKIDAL